MAISLVIGQKTSLTAALHDSMGQPVPNTDPNEIFWTVDSPSIASINPGNQNNSITGPSVYVQANAIGSTNVTANFNNGSYIVSQATQVIVTYPPVTQIAITQGPVS